MKHALIVLIAQVPLLLAVERSASQEVPLALYVGRDVCLECHAAPAPSVGACTLEDIPEHGRSYRALGKTQAAHIAALCGVAKSPQQSRVCLDCHATAGEDGPRWTAPTFDISLGVQCEACHGAGSRHVELSRNAAGDLRGGILRGDRATCDACHGKKPSHTAVLENNYRMPLTEALYKTPVNLVCSPDGERLYVVCQHSNSLIMLDPADGRVLREIGVGRQPHGVAISPDGGTLYVTNRLSDSLSVIDADSGKVVRTVTVGNEPHGVLTDATGRRLYVLNTEHNAVSVIDTERHVEIKRLTTGRGPWSLALSSDGGSLYVSNVRPNSIEFLREPVSEVSVIDTHSNTVRARAMLPGANMLQGIVAVPGRGVVLTTLMRTKNLIPLTRLAQGWTITSGLGVIHADGRVDQLLLDEPNNAFPDPDSVAASPDGRYALVTSGGSNQVALVDIDAMLAMLRAAGERERREVIPNHLGMSSRYVIKRIEVGANPRGIVFSPDGKFAYVANALDDSITVIETDRYTVARTISLDGPEEVTRIRHGERVFHSADITVGRQFSCRSCHPDGHINGLTFDIEADGIGMHPVDNRTLRGIYDTAPFKWEGTNPSLSHQCGPRLAVFFTRLAPYTPEDLEALVQYISVIPRPPNRHREEGGLTLTQRRGKMIFERRTTGGGKEIAHELRCTTCHSRGYKTARTIASVGTAMWLDAPIDIDVDDLHSAGEFGYFGLVYYHDTGAANKPLDAPHLINIYGSPPYLHNGSAPTLEEIWTRCNLYDEHGVTSDLTRRQFNDLIDYLKAL